VKWSGCWSGIHQAGLKKSTSISCLVCGDFIAVNSNSTHSRDEWVRNSAEIDLLIRIEHLFKQKNRKWRDRWLWSYSVRIFEWAMKNHFTFVVWSVEISVLYWELSCIMSAQLDKSSIYLLEKSTFGERVKQRFLPPYTRRGLESVFNIIRFPV
jgi:hypothetical protein